MRDAIRWALILSALGHIALQALEAASSGRWNGRHAGLIRAPGDPRDVGSPSLTALYIAVVLPLAPFPLWPIFGLGLWWGCSWLAFVALAAAYLTLAATTSQSWALWGALAGGAAIPLLVAPLASRRDCWRWPVVFGRPILEWSPRHDSMDSIWLRLRTWRLVLTSLPTVLTRHPFGRRPLGRDLRRYQAATGLSLHDDHAFQEGLQIVYEYGVLGLLGVVAFVGAVGWSVGVRGPGDPWGTSLVVWALTMTGSITLRAYPFPLLGTLLILGAWAS